MDNWGEIIYVNEKHQKVGESVAKGQRGPLQARDGAVTWPCLEMVDWDAGGVGVCHGTSGFLTGCPSASL